MAIMRGGRTNYGEDIGILMCDTVFPRYPGDIGNARTYPFPVRYRIVQGASMDRLLTKHPDERLIAPFIEAAQDLERAGVRAITTSCGYLAPFQRALADAVHVPVFTSALMMVPFLSSMLGKGRKIAIFTETAENLTDELCRRVGWSMGDYPVVVRGMGPDADFPEVYSRDRQTAEWDVLEAEMTAMARAQMEECPETGAILFECTNMGPFARCVQRASGVPVFGINHLIEFVAAAVRPRNYRLLEDEEGR